MEYTNTGFTGIDIIGSFDAEIIISDKYSISVSIDESYADYLDISQDSRFLRVEFSGIPAPRFFEKRISPSASISISVPYLDYVSMANGATLKCNDTLRTAGAFNGYFDKNSRVYGLNVVSDRADISIHRSSKMDLLGDFNYFFVSADGSSDVSFRGNVGQLRISLGSSSSLYAEGSFEDAYLIAGSASSTTLNGDAGAVYLECSGASTIDASGLEAEDVTLNLKNSRADIRVLKFFDAKLYGSSKCSYSSDDRTEVHTFAEKASIISKKKNNQNK